MCHLRPGVHGLRTRVPTPTRGRRVFALLVSGLGVGLDDLAGAKQIMDKNNEPPNGCRVSGQVGAARGTSRLWSWPQTLGSRTTFLDCLSLNCVVTVTPSSQLPVMPLFDGLSLPDSILGCPLSAQGLNPPIVDTFQKLHCPF